MGGGGASRGFYRSVIDTMSDGVYFVDRSRRITFWSRGAERLTGFAAADVVGRRCTDGILNHVDEHGEELCGARCPLKAAMLEGRERETHIYMHHRDGHPQPVWVRASPLPDEDGAVVGAVEVFSDDTEVAAARARLAEMETLSVQDPLTGVGNRRFVETQLDSRLGEWRRDASRFGLLFVDIDRFKAVNDDLGHDAGDQVLAVVARTLRFNLRGSDTVGRFGGEEFVVILPHATPESMVATAERLRALVESSRPLVRGQAIAITVSIGGTLVAEGDTRAEVIGRADEMMYAAKRDGRNRVRIGVPRGRGAIPSSVHPS